VSKLTAHLVRHFRVRVRRHDTNCELLIHLKHTVHFAVIAVLLAFLDPLDVLIHLAPIFKVKNLLGWEQTLINVVIYVDLKV